MATKIFPSHGDVGGAGRTMTEALLHQVLGYAAGGRAGVALFCRSTNPSGRNVEVSVGDAIIAGCLGDYSAAISIEIPDDNVLRYVWLRHLRSGGLVSGRALALTTTSEAPDADHVLVAAARATGGALVELRDERQWVSGTYAGTYSGAGSGSPRLIECAPAGVSSRERIASMVLVSSADPTKSASGNIFSVSQVEGPGRLLGPNSLASQSRWYLAERAATVPLHIRRGYVAHSRSYAIAESYVQTVTVLGAEVGDAVVAAHDDADWTGEKFAWRGWVSAPDTAQVYIENIYPAGVSLSGFLTAWVYRAVEQTIEGGRCVFLDEEAGCDLAPTITPGGFLVEAGSGPPSLDESGRRYSYLAVY